MTLSAVSVRDGQHCLPPASAARPTHEGRRRGSRRLLDEEDSPLTFLIPVLNRSLQQLRQRLVLEFSIQAFVAVLCLA